MDDSELLALAAAPAASDPVTAQTVTGLVAEDIAALGRGGEFDPADAAALVASQEHRFRPRPPEALAGELDRLRGWQRLVAEARDRADGPRQQLLQSYAYDIHAAVISRAQLITEPVGALSGGWGVDRPGGPPCVLLTSQLPPDLAPWPEAGLPFPLWRERASAEAALADLRARPPEPPYGDSARLRTCWTCVQVWDAEQGPVVIDEDFWTGR